MIRLVIFYACSGFLSLIYEVLWMRLMSIQFGVSSFAVVVTVTAFMLGLGIGAWRFSTYQYDITKTPRYLGWIEFGLSLFAIFLPTIIKILTPFIDSAAILFSSELWHVLIFLSALLLLSIPAYAMGAGFSLVLRYAGNQKQSLSWLYGCNTLGAVLGAMWPLWALPLFGWVASLRVAALIGIVLAFAFWFLLPKHQFQENTVSEETTTPPKTMLWHYAFLGALSLTLEVAWTRLFSLIMLRTEYVLALILATFLFGIGLGSLITVRVKRTTWLQWFPWCAALGVLLSLIEFAPVSAYLETATFTNLSEALLWQGVIMLVMTLPVTLILGAWLPLLTQHYEHAGQRFYAVNAVGGGLGALCTGFILIPTFGTTVSLALVALLFALLGFNRHHKIHWIFLLLCVVTLAFVAKMPSTARLLPEEMGHSQDIYHYEDAIAMTEVVQQANGQRYLLTDLQRRDASSEATAVFTQQNQVRFPLLYQGHPHSLLLLGLGTGISDQGSLGFDNLSKTAVELSHGAIVGAKNWFSELNQPALKQTSLIEDDVRHYLSAHSTHYDVIVGDLFHPDLAGVSSLLSLQQFERAKQHLTSHGVFVQWLALNQFDLASFKVVLKTFKTVFPKAVMFVDGMHVALVGSVDESVDINGFVSHNTMPQNGEVNQGEPTINWLGRYWGVIPEFSSPIQDEWSPVIEYALPRLHYAKGNELAKLWTYMMANRASLTEAKASLGVPVSLKDSFERSYIATDFLVRSWLATFNHQDEEANHLIELAYQANPQDRWVQYALSDQLFDNQKTLLKQGIEQKTLLSKILAINPYHVEAWRSLWHLQQREQDPQASQSLRHLLQLAPLDLEANSAKNGGL